MLPVGRTVVPVKYRLSTVGEFCVSNQWQNCIIGCVNYLQKNLNLLTYDDTFSKSQVIGNTVLKWVITSKLTVWN